MKKTGKKLICMLLAVLMLASVGVGAFADKGKDYGYDKYMCIGDSIAAGCALTKSGEETVFDQNSDNFAYVYSEQYIYLGHNYAVVPKAYHSLVSDRIGAELLQCARSGMRAVELRYWLDGVYNDFDETCSWDNTYYDIDGNGFTLKDLDAFNKYINYPEKIKEADIISINLGSNDVFSFTFGIVMRQLTANTTDPNLEKIKEYFESTGDAGAAFLKLLDLYQTMGKIGDLVKVLVKGFNDTYKQYAENYNAVMKKIYELNPDVTVVNVGVFNPLRYVRFSSQLDVDVSFIMAGIVGQMNALLKGYQSKYDNCYFADVSNTETYYQCYEDPLFWQYFTLKVHPTIAGHEYMTNQIVSVIPVKERAPEVTPAPQETTKPEGEKNKLPFKDVSKNYWAYDEIAYVYDNDIMLGKTATTFDPEGDMTRAQFATVLYRLAGKPDVSGKTEPFKDVAKKYWARDAIIWAYNEGIIKGYDDTTFGPDDGINRAQLVTMLYRYNGAPKVKGNLNDFKDCGDLNKDYKTAIIWATKNGIVNGYSDNTFRPYKITSRAELAAILARYMQK